MREMNDKNNIEQKLDDLIAAFNDCTEDTDEFNFSTALKYLKDGKRVCRKEWNQRKEFIFLVPGSTFEVNRQPLLDTYPQGTKVDYHGHIDMNTAEGLIVPWTPSHIDLLAEDWKCAETQTGNYGTLVLTYSKINLSKILQKFTYVKNMYMTEWGIHTVSVIIVGRHPDFTEPDGTRYIMSMDGTIIPEK